MQHFLTPSFAESGNLRQHVGQPGGQEKPARKQHCTVIQGGAESVKGIAGGDDVDSRSGDDDAAVALHIGPAGRHEIEWIHAFPRKETVYACGGGVAWLACVDDCDAAACAPQHERSAEACCSAADDDDVK